MTSKRKHNHSQFSTIRHFLKVIIPTGKELIMFINRNIINDPKIRRLLETDECRSLKMTYVIAVDRLKN